MIEQIGKGTHRQREKLSKITKWYSARRVHATKGKIT